MKELLETLLHGSKEDRKEILIQFMKFGLVGVSNTLVSLAVYYFILFIDPKLYLLGSILGTIISIANAFFWNDRFVFKDYDRDAKSMLKRLLKTYVSYGGTSLLSNILLWAEVTLLHIDKRVAPIINLTITIPLNYLINKLWTFRKDHATLRKDGE